MGDPNGADFSREEVERYYKKAQDEFVRAVRPFLDFEIIEDLPACANYAFEFEARHMDVRTGRASFRFDFEKRYLRRPGRGPVPISFHFERDQLSTAPISAVVDLPEENIQIERVTWDERRAEPLTSISMGQGGVDIRYEIQRGPVEAYITDKDGLNSLRRYKIPAGNGAHFSYIGRFGTLRGSPVYIQVKDRRCALRLGMFARMTDAHTLYAPDVFISLSYTFGFAQLTQAVEQGLLTMPLFSGMTVVGSYGIIRRIPGFIPSRRTWGLVRAVRFDHLNTRVEFYSRGSDPRTERAFVIPDSYLKYLDFYVMAEMYNRQGPYQDLAMAQHYMLRYRTGEKLAQDRMTLTNSMRLVVAGGSIPDHDFRPPLSRPPDNFPEGAFTRRRRRGGRYYGF